MRLQVDGCKAHSRCFTKSLIHSKLPERVAPTMCPALLALPSGREPTSTSLQTMVLWTGSGSGAPGKASLGGDTRVQMEEEEEPAEKSLAGTGQAPGVPGPERRPVWLKGQVGCSVLGT